MSQQASALKIDLRYDYDTHGFFTENPEAKVVMRAAADFFESIIDDKLLPIDPAEQRKRWTATGFLPSDPYSGATIEIPDLVVPEDTLIIFVAGAKLGPAGGLGGPGGFNPGPGTNQQWFDRLAARGKTGALAAKPSDFGPWGGCISIGISDRWNYSLARNIQGGIPLLSVAVHEIAHVLGFGSAPSWKAQLDEVTFKGAYAMAAYGGPVPLEPTDPARAHWRFNLQCVLPHGHSISNPNNVLSGAFGSFGTPHGFDQIALMDPQFCSAGPFLKVFTDLDIAALRDIGWKIRPQRQLFVEESDTAEAPIRLGWISNSLFDYQIERNDSLREGGWEAVAVLPGNGSVMKYQPELKGESHGFFRINVLPRVVEIALDEPLAEPARDPSPSFAGRPPVMVGSCFCHPQLMEP